MKTPISQAIKKRVISDGKKHFASDNISKYMSEDEKLLLIDEVAKKFESVLESLIIDIKDDPNSMDTGRRMAKMYINDIMGGRYTAAPAITAFPNTEAETRYSGLLVTQVEIRSMCSHHHQPVSGKCWIGLIPTTEVIGLSKYGRLAQHLARRGTLQEELTTKIANEIMIATKAEDVGVVMKLRHGCMENRGIMAPNSTTTTSVLKGQFFNPSVKNEFFEMIRGYNND